MKIIHTLNSGQIESLHELYRGEWWTKTRSLEETKKCVEGSTMIFGCVRDDRLVGFARVLTDYVFKAMIYDVIVAEDERSKGIGEFIITSILEHPEIKPVRHVELYCVSDRISFYERFGFTKDIGTTRLMRFKKA